ncbi:unnamed protein product [Owenia fusiformis]|uniref:Uncharacterized protein n=1 Tax=Owenia fusiformis TaxID=6347 RepID=A0A8J1UAU7_OWEFU|nr:unnamed protein product [Owenia fusiformis]
MKLFVGLIGFIAALQTVLGDVRIFGDPLDSSSRVLISGARRVWLLLHLKLETGVITQFKAYFHNENPVRFQTWRELDPVNLPGQLYLVNQIRVQAHSPGLKQIHLNQFKMLHVKKGDIIGVLHEREEATIGYREGSIPYLYGNFQGTDFPNPFLDVLKFYKGVWRFKHSIEFALDTDYWKYPDPPPTPITPTALTTPPISNITTPRTPTTTRAPMGAGPASPLPPDLDNTIVEEIEPVPIPKSRPRENDGPRSDQKNDSDLLHSGILVIVGGAVGGFVVLNVSIVIVVAIYCTMKKRKSETQHEYVIKA